MRFYLGAYNSSWFQKTDVPLFVSHMQLYFRKRLKPSLGRWALDSGGFTQLSKHGRWTISRAEYIDSISMYIEKVGNLDWCSPQDWMCEPWIVQKTGKTVAEHQALTVENFCLLRQEAPTHPFIPVLQGWSLDDYLRCVELYENAGVDLKAQETVGVGSVCRRQSADEIAEIVGSLAQLGLRLHGFGVKTRGVRKYAQHLTSADSMAWSFAARYGQVKLDECSHPRCNNCIVYAHRWRDSVLATLPS